jgi:arylsulfatase A-like enzyme
MLLITIDTLRADHLGLYGYRRGTSPAIDQLGRQSQVFDEAYTYWPKTRGSMVILHTGTLPSQNGYSRTHPVLFPFNKTMASLLKGAGYRTTAAVDNSNVAAANGYAAGFDAYRQTWEEANLASEADRGRAITESALALFAAPPKEPFFLWLHYVNPHAPYTPPPPFDSRFRDEASKGGTILPLVKAFHGGIHEEWATAMPGPRTLPYFVSQYDGEVATADAEVGRVVESLASHGLLEKTVVLLVSDHGESLGEHDYYFDHGEDLFRPCLHVPLILRVPGGKPLRRSDLVSTLDALPTVLDALKVSYPAGLAGRSLLEPPLPDRRLFAQNDRDLAGSFDSRFALLGAPGHFVLYDRRRDPGELHDAGKDDPEELRTRQRELEVYLDRRDAEMAMTRRLTEGVPKQATTQRSCDEMRALQYLTASEKCP